MVYKTGDRANTKRYTMEENRAGGRRVRVTTTRKGGVVTRFVVELNRAVIASAGPEMRRHLERFARLATVDAAAAAETREYLDEQARAVIRMHIAKAAAAADATSVRDKEDFRAAARMTRGTRRRGTPSTASVGDPAPDRGFSDV